MTDVLWERRAPVSLARRIEYTKETIRLLLESERNLLEQLEQVRLDTIEERKELQLLLEQEKNETKPQV